MLNGEYAFITTTLLLDNTFWDQAFSLYESVIEDVNG